MLSPKSLTCKTNVLQIGWKPLPQGVFKLNTDGSTHGNSGRASVGGIIRDHNGNWIGSFNRADGFLDPLKTTIGLT